MNLQPFYELRERLLVSAAAGVQFIQEDFRLREAAKKLEVFAKASPVFAKMSQMLEQLIGEGKAEKAELLLDLLGLLDAFLTTQGSSQSEGELLLAVNVERKENYIKKDNASLYQEIPYSRLQPLKWALTETGSGRQSTLEDIYEREPELFMDFRIYPLMIGALGDMYAEIAEMVCNWLIAIGEPVLPALKEGFLPKGKKEMVRRVRAITEIAGEKENEFYRTQIPESEKDVRDALIRALRFSQENQPLLFDLLKTEKGKLKMTVRWTLGFMDDEETAKFWHKRASTNPVETAELLRYSTASYAPAILAALVKDIGEQILAAEEENERKKHENKKNSKEKQEELERRKILDEKFTTCISCCTGKIGKEICGMLEWSVKEERLKRFRVIFARMMTDTIIRTPFAGREAKAYYALAGQLFRQEGREYARPAFAAGLFSLPASETYDEFSRYIANMGYSIFRVLQEVRYQEGKGYFIRIEKPVDERGEAYGEEQFRVIEQGLDLRWYPLIIENKKNCPGDYPEVYTSFRGADAVLYRLLRTDIPDVCQQYGEYFYHRAVTAEPSASHVEVLKKCGWTKFDGILVQASKKNFWSYQLRQLVNALPISREELIKELELIQMNWSSIVKNSSSAQPNQTRTTISANAGVIKRWLEILHNGGTREELM